MFKKISKGHHTLKLKWSLASLQDIEVNEKKMTEIELLIINKIQFNTTSKNPYFQKPLPLAANLSGIN